MERVECYSEHSHCLTHVWCFTRRGSLKNNSYHCTADQNNQCITGITRRAPSESLNLLCAFGSHLIGHLSAFHVPPWWWWTELSGWSISLLVSHVAYSAVCQTLPCTCDAQLSQIDFIIRPRGRGRACKQGHMQIMGP